MKIAYKCDCMKEEGEIDVPNRVAGGDIVTWMNLITMCIGYDHGARQPWCRAEKTHYVKIPIDDAANGIGVPATRQ